MLNLRKLCIIVVIFSFASIFAQQQSQQMQTANKLLKEKKYEEAISAFKVELKNNSKNSFAWYYIGTAEYSLKNYDEAINAYKMAMEGLKGPTVSYNLAGVYALLGDKENAYKWLEEAITKGFGQYKTLEKDNDFASINKEDRFKKLLEKAKINGNPCLAREEYSQFNFWVGKWDVVNPAGNHAGDSEIDLMNNGCTIVENWTGAGGFVGKSFNYFDTTDNKWHQFWINQNAQKTTFEGNLIDGNMVYYSYDHVKDEKNPYLERLTFFNLGPDKVRQFDERSTDQGKTWTVGYDLTYNRKTNSD